MLDALRAIIAELTREPVWYALAAAWLGVVIWSAGDRFGAWERREGRGFEVKGKE